VKRGKKKTDWELNELGQHPEFLKLIAAARARFAAGRKLSLEEMKRAVLPQRLPKRRKRATSAKGH
jgi:hypothetical protein